MFDKAAQERMAKAWFMIDVSNKKYPYLAASCPHDKMEIWKNSTIGDPAFELYTCFGCCGQAAVYV